MSVVADCFTIGSVVACKTCYNQDIEGEVLAFDPQTKMLILKCPSSSGKAELNDVNIVNLSLVSDVQIKKEAAPAAPETPHSLNLQLLDRRVRNQIEEKKRLVSAMSCDDPEGQRLFLAIAKTIKDVSWVDRNIRVFSQLTITPPYRVEDIRGDPDSKEYTHIRKVVERHVRERAGCEQ